MVFPRYTQDGRPLVILVMVREPCSWVLAHTTTQMDFTGWWAKLEASDKYEAITNTQQGTFAGPNGERVPILTTMSTKRRTRILTPGRVKNGVTHELEPGIYDNYVEWLRAWYMPLLDGSKVTLKGTDGQPHPNCLAVRYNEFIADPSGVGQALKYLGLPVRAEVGDGILVPTCHSKHGRAIEPGTYVAQATAVHEALPKAAFFEIFAGRRAWALDWNRIYKYFDRDRAPADAARPYESKLPGSTFASHRLYEFLATRGALDIEV